MYFSFTTCLIKTDLSGNIIGSVNGLIGHMGCIAYNDLDGKVYGSLEFKHDSVGSEILENIGYTETMQDGFYIACFDADKIDRLNIDAEKSGVMQCVFLYEVYNDYSAEGHRLGCSEIDGITLVPAIGEKGDAEYIYVPMAFTAIRKERITIIR